MLSSLARSPVIAALCLRREVLRLGLAVVDSHLPGVWPSSDSADVSLTGMEYSVLSCWEFTTTLDLADGKECEDV